MTDFATQRKAMVDSQVRPSDVTDRRIPRAMLEVPREAFAPTPLQAVAYSDGDLKLAGGRVLLAPRVLSKMMQHLEIGDDAVVLDVGGATGYSAALLSHLAKRVVALECDQGLAERARGMLGRDGNVQVVTGPLTEGYADEGPYDAILLNGAVTDIPPALLDQLKDGGRLVAVAIDRGVGRATVWRRFGSQFDRRPLFDAAAPMLPGFERKAEFVF